METTNNNIKVAENNANNVSNVDTTEKSNDSVKINKQSETVYEDEPVTKVVTSDSTYSAEAGAARLAKLPKQICDEIKKLGYDIAFKKFIEELVDDVRSNRSSGDNIDSFENMWYRMALTICNSFYYRNFGRRYGARQEADDALISNELREYICQTPVLDVIQTFIDLTQQDGNLNNKQNQDEQFIRYHRFLYRSFVTLYHQCNGTWKPQKHNNNRKRQGSKTKRFNSKSQRSTFIKPRYNSNDHEMSDNKMSDNKVSGFKPRYNQNTNRTTNKSRGSFSRYQNGKKVYYNTQPINDDYEEEKHEIKRTYKPVTKGSYQRSQPFDDRNPKSRNYN
ncbi:hypothetical protein QLL95_gp0759 [Cotonvirus japonicus]|uniref:Uncharacterized protein n=1 Tax=Cotonvirus japonicus TaxID=2811091 RepID=A0ABM7NT58_9VIRU|nr:hypothetical protein QLL95_gp0759 [Cotonvirus japonicus]BCS83364.1 hypothetical protein [Cotonvirus japonicus]